jgi:hypothetical protein
MTSKVGRDMVGLLRLVVLATALMATTAAASLAQAAAPALTLPTTKILAIGSLTAKATPDARRSTLPTEVRETVRLYLDGKIDQWYVKQDQSGVVFVMNLTDPEEARALLDKLPLGQAGLMTFQLIPLGPLSPLRLLLAEPAK